MSCTSTWCMAVIDGQYRTMYGTTWSAAKAAAGGDSATFFVTMDLSCPTTTSCTLVGILGSGPADAGAKRWNGSSWSVRSHRRGPGTPIGPSTARSPRAVPGRRRPRAASTVGRVASWTSRTTFATRPGAASTSLDCGSTTSCLRRHRPLRQRARAGPAAASWPRSYPLGGSLVRARLCRLDLPGRGPGLECTCRVRKERHLGARPPQAHLRPVSCPRCCATSRRRCFSLASGSYLPWNGTSWSDYHVPAGRPWDLRSRGLPHHHVLPGRCTGQPRGALERQPVGQPRSRAAPRGHRRGTSTASARASAWRRQTARAPS